MSTTNGPFTLVLNSEESIPNPTLGGQDFTAVQIQNSSVFVLTVIASGLTYTLQPFVAQTVPLTGDGASIMVIPTQNPSGLNVVAAFNTITAVWLLQGEAPPQQDGPLTAAAILAGIGSTGVAGANGLQSTSGSIISGGVLAISKPVPFTFWGWGYTLAQGAAPPTTGCGLLELPTPGTPPTDTLSPAGEPASSRLAGAQCSGTPQGGSIQNLFNETLDFYYNWSPIG